MSLLEREITAEEIATFNRDGGVLLKNILPRKWIDRLRDGMEKLRANPGDMTSVRTDGGGKGTAITDQFPSLRIPELNDFLENSPAASIAGALLGKTVVNSILDQAFYKESGRVVGTPWHSDHSYINVEGSQQVRTWICCDPSPAAVNVSIVRGSHRWNLTYRNYTPGNTDVVVKETGENFVKMGSSSDEHLPIVPDIDKYSDSFDIISWDVSPGDVLAFDAHVLHGAGSVENNPNKRRAFAIVWGGDDVRYVKRSGMTVPDIVSVKGADVQVGDLISDYPDVFTAVGAGAN